MSKRERLMFRVEKGAFVPADSYTLNRLRERGYRIGDILAGEFTKPRNPGFWGLAHRLGEFCISSIDAFTGLKAHDALKKIQIDGGIECEITHTDIPGVGVLVSKKPRSLSFESMDQGEFYEVMRAMSRHIADKYFPHMSAEAIERMAGCMVEE